MNVLTPIPTTGSTMESFCITDAEQWSAIRKKLDDNKTYEVCGECNCLLTEEVKNFWCSSRCEFACLICAGTIEKCEDEMCGCCHSFECECEMCCTEEEEYRTMMLLGLVEDDDEEEE